MSFSDLALIEPLQRALDMLGYQQPTPVQAQAIPAVLAGRDLLATARTGTGKTAAFALPLLQQLAAHPTPTPPQAVRVLVLVPTRELAEQVFASFSEYGHFLPLRYCAIYGGVPMQPQITRLARGVDVLVATPGRLLDLLRKGALHLQETQALVLDEADRMLDLGFAQDLEAIFRALPVSRQTLLFSATFSPAIRSLASRLLTAPAQVEASPRNATAQGVKQWLVPCDKKRKTELFCHLLKRRRWGQALVFVKTRRGVDALLETLGFQGFAAAGIHGDKAQAERLGALERFKRGEVQLLIATDVAARGLDIEELPLVVNFDLPTTAEDYVHRIGRTARAGASGTAVSLVCADEVAQLAAIEALIQQTIKRVEESGFVPEHRLPQTAPEGQRARGGKRTGKPVSAPGKAIKSKPAKASAGRSGARAGKRSKPSITARQGGKSGKT